MSNEAGEEEARTSCAAETYIQRRFASADRRAKIGGAAHSIAGIQRYLPLTRPHRDRCSRPPFVQEQAYLREAVSVESVSRKNEAIKQFAMTLLGVGLRPGAEAEGGTEARQ